MLLLHWLSMLHSDIVSVHSVGLGECDEVRKTVCIVSLLNCSSFGLMLLGPVRSTGPQLCPTPRHPIWFSE